MYRYVLKRTFFMLVTVFAACALTFVLMNAIPGATPELILKHTFVGLEESANTIQIAEVSERYDLNSPLYVQFFEWFKGAILRGDLGTSYVHDRSVVHLLALRFPSTLILAISSMAIAGFFGVVFGIYSALCENRFTDHFLRVISLFGVSMPGFWIGLILILIFSVKLKIVPVVGYGEFENLILPAVALSIHSMASILRVTRVSLLETLGEDYIKFAIAKGLPLRTMVTRHALKNAILPVITVFGFQMGHLLGGTVVIEQIFSWPGIGSLLVDSIFARDIPVVQGCITVIVMMFLLVNFFVDISYTYLDPRIRYN